MCIDIANTPKVHGLSLDKKTGKWPKKIPAREIQELWKFCQNIEKTQDFVYSSSQFPEKYNMFERSPKHVVN